MKKLVLTPAADGQSGTYVVAEATIADVVNPSVTLDKSTELVRLAGLAAVLLLLVRS